MLSIQPAYAERVIVFPKVESSNDIRPRFPLEVLELALSHSDFPYRLQASAAAMPQSRSLAMLARGTGPSIVWTVPDRQRRTSLRMVRFPIDRGLIGWRVLLIRPADRDRFASVKTVEDLRAYRLVQGHDWPDTQVLRHNGLQVDTSSHYANLFDMLAAARVDAMPRSVTEINGEWQANHKRGLTIEPNLLLTYPSGLFFFVHPDDDELANALESGLAIAAKNGTHMALLRQHYQAELSTLRLPQRRVIQLAHPEHKDAEFASSEAWMLRPGDWR